MATLRRTGAMLGVLGAAIAAVAIPAVAGAAKLPQGSENVKLDPAEFTTQIDNPYFPLTPGDRYVYRETDAEGAKQKVVLSVSDKTKQIANGITARVVHDRATEHGKPVEDTFDWYAQDSDGNVWYMGEDTVECEKGHIATRAGSFESGVQGAQPGVVMAAHPKEGLAYRQEFFPGQAEDQAEIMSLDEMAEVPFGHVPHALMIKETNPIEPKVEEFKFYAQGVGPVEAVAVSGGTDREELLRIRHNRDIKVSTKGRCKANH